jgi:hypothetical protein
MAASPNDLIRAEKQLLVCCARTHLQPPVAGEIRRLLSLPLDWDFLLAEAVSHSVSPLLLRHIGAVAHSSELAAQIVRLKDHVRAASVHSLVLTAELIRILKAFAAAGIEAIPYKGPVLAAQAYGDIALREFADVDLVLRQSEIAAADELLVGLGIAPQFPAIFAPGKRSPLIPGEYDYRDRERHLTVELHTERTLRHFPLPPDLNDLAGRFETVSLSGHDVRTFSPEDTLVFLCVHGSKDFWERLGWVADISQVLVSNPDLDWNCVYAFADSVRARRMLHLGLSLADRLIGILLPDPIRQRLGRDTAALAIAAHMQDRLLGRLPLPLSARASFAYRRQMVPGSIAGLRYAMRLSTAPAAEDWQSFRLPRPFAPFYAALRPIRLLRKYGPSQERAVRPPS